MKRLILASLLATTILVGEVSAETTRDFEDIRIEFNVEGEKVKYTVKEDDTLEEMERAFELEEGILEDLQEYTTLQINKEKNKIEYSKENKEFTVENKEGTRELIIDTVNKEILYDYELIVGTPIEEWVESPITNNEHVNTVIAEEVTETTEYINEEVPEEDLVGTIEEELEIVEEFTEKEGEVIVEIPETIEEITEGITEDVVEEVIEEEVIEDLTETVEEDVVEEVIEEDVVEEVIEDLTETVEESDGYLEEYTEEIVEEYTEEVQIDGLQPHVASYKEEVANKFGVTSFSTYRPGDPQDHGKGLAVDFMVPVGSQQGDDIAQYSVDNLHENGISYVIWKQQIYGDWNNQWEMMEDRGSVTQNHFDHVHVSFY